METTTGRNPEITKAMFYGGSDPSDIPLYTVAAAARTLKLPVSTVRWWVRGRNTEYDPVIRTESRELLSFNVLLELYVVKILRRSRGITLASIRRAVEYAEAMSIPRVLLSDELATFGGNVLLRGLTESVALSLSGQRALHEMLEGLAQRIDRHAADAPVLYPDFAGERLVNIPRPVSVSPVVAFGTPTLRGYGIRTTMIKARIDSGETVNEVGDDYGVPSDLVTGALLFENAVH